jgi:hypothetical protein
MACCHHHYHRHHVLLLLGFFGGGKISGVAEDWSLMPVFLATWEAEVERIAVQSQPKQIVLKTLSPK